MSDNAASKPAKKSQKLTVWLFPIITFGGLFYPPMGYVFAAVILFGMSLNLFKLRYWCWNLCPRGALFQIVLSRICLNRPVPAFCRSLGLGGAYVTYQFICRSDELFMKIGSALASYCFSMSVITSIVVVLTKPRGWCAISPTGDLSAFIHKLGNRIRK
jgi:hypothetical protein